MSIQKDNELYGEDLLNYKQLLILIFVIPFLFLIFLPQAQSTGYLPSTFKLLHTPTLCEVEPEDAKIPYIGTMMLSITHDSVNDWITKLNQGTTDNLVWNINEIQIPLSAQKDYNYTTCDIQMRYLPQPVNKTEIFQTVGTISYDFNNNKASVIIYYLEIENKLEAKQTYGYELIPQYSDSPMSYPRLKQTISHEIGHALGLGHYHEVNQEQLNKWIEGYEIPPSIMVEMQGANAKYFGVTQNDVEQVKLKYGPNGFGGQTFFGLPHEIETSTTNQSISSMESAGCSNDRSTTFGSAPLITKTGAKTGITILFQYSPVTLYENCKNLWMIDFVMEKNTTLHLANVYYGIFMQQDTMRSLAKEQGKDYFFTADGKGTHEIGVKEKEGVVYYWIVVYVTPPQRYDEGKIGGAALLFLNVAHKTIQKSVYTPELAPWVKNIARWWSTGQMQDYEFVEAIQYLIHEKIINVEKIQYSSNNVSHIPSWLKNNAGWWANGKISDKDFLVEIQFMVNNGMIKP